MPSDSVLFLSLDEALEIHRRLVARFGGTGGVRDKGLLESALYRPRTGHYRDLAEMGAALFESLLMNHPFVDGNKRVAFFATDVFFRINGWMLRVDDEATHRFVVGLLDDGHCDFDHLLPWIRKALVRFSRP